MYCLLEFAQAVKVKRMLTEEASDPAQNFWHYINGTLMDLAAIQWCMVSGSDENDTHWKRVVLKDQHDAVRSDMLKAIKLDADGWKAYWSSVVDCRNQLAAHRDLQAKVMSFPHYDPALAAADFMYTRLYPMGDVGDLPQRLDVWSNHVANNMAAIVRVAFKASSSTFGPHMPA